MFLSAPTSLRILHISDVHIGDEDVVRADGSTRIEHPGWKNLQAEFSGSQTCIVTGDLCKSSPSESVLTAIRDELGRAFPQLPHQPAGWLVVPGNHDRRAWGNFWLDRTTFDSAFKDWKAAWWSIEKPIIIIPLDSNPDSKSGRRVRWGFDLARGCLGEESSRIKETLAAVRAEVVGEFGSRIGRLGVKQQAQVVLGLAAAFPPGEITQARQAVREQGSLNASVKSRLAEVLTEMFMARTARCVLMHHHPVGIVDTENLGLTAQDAYLTLTDSGNFISEAVLNEIDLVCHGHKHMPHRTLVSFPTPRGHEHQMAVVGCGSSTQTGASLKASANSLDISSGGEVAVRLKSFAGATWAFNPTPIAVRSWPSVRARLSRSSAKHALVSAGTCNITVNIAKTGDAVISTQWNDVHIRPEAIQDGKVWIPLSADCDTHVLEPEVIFLDRGLGRGGIEGSHVGSMRSWQGFLVAPIIAATGVSQIACLEVQYKALCCFSTEGWQYRLLHPEQPLFQEQYTWSCDIPIRDRLTMIIRTSAPSQLRLERPLPICASLPVENGPADEEPSRQESRACNLVSMVGEQEVVLSAERPLWGYSYGVRWSWRGKSLPPRGGRSHILKATAGRKVEVGTLLGRLGNQLELVYFVLGADGRLTQLVQNDSVIKAGHSEWVTQLGVGVAGRAAYIGKAVVWDTNEPSSTPWYVPPPEGVPGHGVIVALPLVQDQYGTIGVLCASEGRHGALAEAVGRRNRGESVAEEDILDRVAGLANEIGALLSRS